MVRAPRLDDRPDRVLRQLDLGRQRDVVRAAIDPVDDEVAALVQLVHQALGGDAAQHRRRVLARRKHRQLARRLAHGALHRADDVAAFAHRAQDGFGIALHGPHGGHRLRQPHALQVLQAADQQAALRVLRNPLQRNDAEVGLALQAAVEAGPARLLDFPLQRLLDLAFAARPEPFGGQLAGPLAHPIGDVVAGDDEVAPDLVLAAHDDVGVWVAGVPVVDRDPVQAGAEVRFDPRHRLPGEAVQVAQLFGVLGRDD